MLRRYLKRLAAAFLLAAAIPATLTAQIHFDSRSGDFNPALSAISRRSILEVGVDADVAAYNNAFSAGDIFQPTWTIDVSQLAQDTNWRGLQVGTNVNAAATASLRLFGVGLNAYTRAETMALLTIPDGLLELVGTGNIEDYNGTGSVLLRASAEAGGVLTAEVGNWTFGLGVGMSVPVAYSGDGGVDFSLVTDQAGFDATADLDMEIYSALDLQAVMDGQIPDVMSAIQRGAYKVDLGVIYRDGDTPRWGIAVNDITIIRGTAPYAVRATASYSAAMENVIQTILDDPNAQPIQLTSEDFVLTTIDGGSQRITLAPGFTGFYTISIPFLDITPHVEIIMGSAVGAVNPGVTIAGNRFPTNMLYLGFGHTKPLWRAVAGLRIPLYIMELNVQVESSSPRLGGLFSLQGATAAVDLRIGF